jgi:hypothetical protein
MPFGEYKETPKMWVTHPDGIKTLEYIVDTKAYAPKVDIANEIFPDPSEVWNCTNCTRGTNLFSVDKERYFYWCRADCKKHIARKWNDIDCGNFDRKIKKPVEVELEW